MIALVLAAPERVYGGSSIGLFALMCLLLTVAFVGGILIGVFIALTTTHRHDNSTYTCYASRKSADSAPLNPRSTQ